MGYLSTSLSCGVVPGGSAPARQGLFCCVPLRNDVGVTTLALPPGTTIKEPNRHE